MNTQVAKRVQVYMYQNKVFPKCNVISCSYINSYLFCISIWLRREECFLEIKGLLSKHGSCFALSPCLFLSHLATTPSKPGISRSSGHIVQMYRPTSSFPAKPFGSGWKLHSKLVSPACLSLLVLMGASIRAMSHLFKLKKLNGKHLMEGFLAGIHDDQSQHQ